MQQIVATITFFLIAQQRTSDATTINISFLAVTALSLLCQGCQIGLFRKIWPFLKCAGHEETDLVIA